MKKLQKLSVNGRADVLWYGFCFALLGLIDQRRGSAEGLLQMVFVNLTGIVVGMLLLPSIQRRFWHSKPCKIWSAFCVPGMIIGCMAGRLFWPNIYQWYMAAANVAVIGYLIIYIGWNRNEIREKSRLNRGCFFLIMLLLLLLLLLLFREVFVFVDRESRVLRAQGGSWRRRRAIRPMNWNG